LDNKKSGRKMFSKEIVEEAVAAILKEDRSYCECRRSPFDGHDVNPPCPTRVRVTEQVRLTLEVVENHKQDNTANGEEPKSLWAIFGTRSGAWSDPITPARFSSKESAQKYIKDNYPNPEWLQVRRHTGTGWSV
jgi:hypothetical protein